eukprot:5768651-Prorocentrum_lima.AAC.1
MPKNGPIARGLHAAFNRLVAEHGWQEMLPLHREGNLYNFYLEGGDWKHINPLEASGASGEHRRAQKP